jgi:hypothetical protein
MAAVSRTRAPLQTSHHQPDVGRSQRRSRDDVPRTAQESP